MTGEPSGKPTQTGKMTPADWVLAALFAATIVVVAAQVLWRYVFNDSLIWTEELSRYLFTWMTLIGAAVAVREATHVRITTLTSRLPARAARVLTLAQLALIVVFLGYLVVVGCRWVRINADTLTPALGLPLNYALYAALPVAAGLGVWFGIRRFITVLGTKPEPPKPAREDA